MFAIVSIVRITELEILNKPKCTKTNSNFQKFENTENPIKNCLRNVGNDDLYYVCHS